MFKYKFQHKFSSYFVSFFHSEACHQLPKKIPSFIAFFRNIQVRQLVKIRESKPTSPKPRKKSSPKLIWGGKRKLKKGNWNIAKIVLKDFTFKKANFFFSATGMSNNATLFQGIALISCSFYKTQCCQKSFSSYCFNFQRPSPSAMVGTVCDTRIKGVGKTFLHTMG